MSHPLSYATRPLTLACLLAGLTACDGDRPPRCVSNAECDAPREVCDRESRRCVPAPDAAVMVDEGPPDVGCVPSDERCNGADDDCDGSADEGFDVSAACAVGEGVCRANGVRVCAEDGAGVTCDAVPGDPADEACNGLDDDCNGEVDDGIGPTPCIGGTGGCEAAGEVLCVDGALVCDAVAGAPADEACNGADDDCDGATDEGAPHPCSPFALTGGRVTWAAGTSRSADRAWTLSGRGVVVSEQALEDEGQRYRLTGGAVKVAGEIEMRGQ